MNRNFTLIELVVIQQLLVQVAIPLQVVAAQYDADIAGSSASNEVKREIRSVILFAIAVKLIKDPTLGDKLMQSSGLVARVIRNATIDFFRRQKRISGHEFAASDGQLEQSLVVDASAEVDFLLRLRMVLAGDTLQYAFAKIEGFTDLEFRLRTGQKAADVARHRQVLKEVLLS